MFAETAPCYDHLQVSSATADHDSNVDDLGVPIEHRSNIDQQRGVLILVLPIRTKGHSGGARGFVISESKIVGDCN